MIAGYSNHKKTAHNVAQRIRKQIEQNVIPPFSVNVMGQKKLSEIIRGCDLEEAIFSTTKNFLSQPSRQDSNYYETLSKALSVASILEKESKQVDHQQLSTNLQNVRKFIHGMQRITASLGLAVRQPDESVEDLIYHADRALYHAKENGKNQVCKF